MSEQQQGDALLRRIAQAEKELQSVIQNRSGEIETQYASSPHQVHQDNKAKDRWRTELEARMTDLDNSDKFATTTELWDKDGRPRHTQDAQDAEEFTDAVMECLPEGESYADVVDASLAGTNYADFGSWFCHSESYDPNAPIDRDAIFVAVSDFLSHSTSLSATAVNAGGSPQAQFAAAGISEASAATPGQSRAAAQGSHDLVAFIQSQQEAAPQQPKPRTKVLVHVTVEIGDGRSGTIDVHEGDDARALAADFAREHNLSEQVVGPLSIHVQSSIEAVKPQLHTPKKKPTPSPSVRRSAGKSSSANADWVSRMSRPLRAAPASMDPSRSMTSTPTGLFSESLDMYDNPDDADPVVALGMTPQSTSAAQAYLASKEQKSGLDERGSQLSARMRKSGKAAMAVSARLYKDASTRRTRLKKAQQDKEKESAAALEEEIIQERQRWGGEAKKQATTARFTIDANGEQRKVDVCDVLYSEHEKRQQKQKQAVDKHLKMLKEKEDDLLKQSNLPKWGVPKISRRAKETTRVGNELWERICDWDGTQRKKHLTEMRKQRDVEDLEACTFDIKSSIAADPEAGFGGRSSRLVDKMTSSVAPGHEIPGSRFEALYNDARQRQLRIEQYENWYPEDQTFQPDIGYDKYRPRTDETEEEFVNRLAYCKQDKMRSTLPASSGQEVDQNTGQRLFHPQTGRAPLFQRNSSGLPIGEYLHSYAFEKAERRNEKESAHESQFRSLSNQPKTSINSQIIMENLRQQQLYEIFSMFHQDSDGRIDPAAAERAVEFLPPLIANDIVPLVMESDKPLDFKDFYDLCRDVASSAQVGPKGYLITERERHLRSREQYVQSKENPNLQLTLSRQSESLAEATRASRAGSLYDALSEEREIWEERRRNMSEKRAAEDLAACTFQPNVERVGVNPRMSTEVAKRLVKPARSVRAF